MAKLTGPCMFCGGSPCQCDGGPKKKSSGSTRKASSPKTSSEVGANSAPSDKDTEDVFGEIPQQVKPRFKSKSHSERNLSYESAIRALRPILSPKSQREVDRELARTYPQELDKRVEKWRGREKK